MPVFRTSEKPLMEGNRPDERKITTAGGFAVPTKIGRFDCHCHDFDPYRLVFRGKAKILIKGKSYYVKAGDLVCTTAGGEHHVLEVREHFGAFWFEDPCPPDGRVGSLRRGAEKARGRAVSANRLPADFAV